MSTLNPNLVPHCAACGSIEITLNASLSWFNGEWRADTSTDNVYCPECCDPESEIEWLPEDTLFEIQTLDRDGDWEADFMTEEPEYGNRYFTLRCDAQQVLDNLSDSSETYRIVPVSPEKRKARRGG